MIPIISGTSASAMHFQAYLMEGLVRWNENRAAAAADENHPHSYSSLLKHVVRSLGSTVLQKDLVPDYRHPGKYTGNYHLVLVNY